MASDLHLPGRTRSPDCSAIVITNTEQYHRLHEVLTWLESLQEALPDGDDNIVVEQCLEKLAAITPPAICLHIDPHPGWRDS